MQRMCRESSWRRAKEGAVGHCGQDKGCAPLFRGGSFECSFTEDTARDSEIDGETLMIGGISIKGDCGGESGGAAT